MWKENIFSRVLKYNYPTYYFGFGSDVVNFFSPSTETFGCPIGTQIQKQIKQRKQRTGIHQFPGVATLQSHPPLVWPYVELSMNS